MKNTEKSSKKYAIYNHKNERMYQFGWYEYIDIAERVLREVSKKYPYAKFHIVEL